MPIYEYKCVDCKTHFEKLQKVSDDLIRKCENCGGTLEKQWSLSGFQFKGAGWYVTDYAKDKNGKAAVKDGDSDKNAKSESTEKPKSASKKENSGVSSSKKGKVSEKD